MEKDIPGCLGGTCVWSCAQIPEKHRAKPCFALQNKNTACQFRCGVARVGRAISAGCQHPRLWSTHLNKSLVSAEGWNVRLCCGSEVQINVRRELRARRFEGEDGCVGWRWGSQKILGTGI